MSQPASSSRKPGKFYLKPPPSIMPGQSYSYTEPSPPKGEVRFVLPGAKQKETEITPFNSTDTPQPFIDADVLERWRRERGRSN